MDGPIGRSSLTLQREQHLGTSERRDRVAGIPASYSGGPGFKSWPGHRPI
jgi:hypothetical protein